MKNLIYLTTIIILFASCQNKRVRTFKNIASGQWDGTEEIQTPDGKISNERTFSASISDEVLTVNKGESSFLFSRADLTAFEIDGELFLRVAYHKEKRIFDVLELNDQSIVCFRRNDSGLIEYISLSR